MIKERGESREDICEVQCILGENESVLFIQGTCKHPMTTDRL